MSTADVCRRHGISSETFYKWKSKYGGPEVSDARRLRQLEQENERLKKLLADSMLDRPTQPLIRGINGPWAMLKEISAKNSSARCQAAGVGSSPGGLRFQLMTAAFRACEVPTIAAVNGATIGLGFDLTIQCDIRIAARTAVFSEAFASMGLVPGAGGFWFLPRIVGYAKALELTVTGRRIDATAAENCGLVTSIVEKGAALDAALELANDTASRSPHAVRISKRLLRAAGETSLHTALDMGAMAQALLTGSHDQLEAVSATIGRRQPNFQAR